MWFFSVFQIGGVGLPGRCRRGGDVVSVVAFCLLASVPSRRCVLRRCREAWEFRLYRSLLAFWCWCESGGRWPGAAEVDGGRRPCCSPATVSFGGGRVQIQEMRGSFPADDPHR